MVTSILKSKLFILQIALIFFIALAATSQALVFSHEPGWYTESFTLTTTLEGDEAYATYTNDGNIPTMDSPKLTSLLIETPSGAPSALALNPNITHIWYDAPKGDTFKGTILRVATFQEDGTKINEYGKTYFVHPLGVDRYKLPVFSFITEPKNLDDYEIGIYVKGKVYDDNLGWDNGMINFHPTNFNQRGGAWERLMHVELLDDNDLIVSQFAGLRTHGRFTSAYTQKGLRIYTKTGYGIKYFNHPAFGDEGMDKYEVLILRNSGQDWYNARMRDMVAHKLVSNMNIDTQAGTPAILFLNGEFWGLYNLRERIDDKYLAATYDLDRGELVVLEGPGYIDEGDEGDNQPYYDLVNYMKSHDLKVQSNYDHVATQVDIDNVMDYYLANIFMANGDFGNDYLFWKTKSPEGPESGRDGKWKFVFKDIDQGLGLYNPNNYDQNTLELFLDKDALPDYATLLFRSLMRNDEFRNEFIDRGLYYLNNDLDGDTTIIDEYAALMRPHMYEQTLRWKAPFNVEGWEKSVADLKNWVEMRPQHVRAHLEAVRDWSGGDDIVVITPGCAVHVSDLPATCSGNIVSDVSSGDCRTIRCEEGDSFVNVLACQKTGYYEMYKHSFQGSTLEVCLADDCLSTNGYLRGSEFPICFEEVPVEPPQEPGNETPSECKSSVEFAEVSCDGGTIIADSFSGSCRTVSCESGENSLSVLACDKPSTLEVEYYEAYKTQQVGSGLTICVGEACIGKNGFARTDATFCEETPVTPPPIVTEPKVTVSIAPWYPKDRSYVFVCNVENEVALKYDFFYGDGNKNLGHIMNNAYYTYSNPGAYEVVCNAHVDGNIVSGKLNINVV